jgi:hypothetical protein
MTHYLFLLLFVLMLCLVYLWLFDLPQHFCPRTRRRAAHTLVQRLRHRHALQAIAPSVASPAPSHRMWGLCLYVPGVR